jgi:hypothetical protein
VATGLVGDDLVFKSIFFASVPMSAAVQHLVTLKNFIPAGMSKVLGTEFKLVFLVLPVLEALKFSLRS